MKIAELKERLQKATLEEFIQLKQELASDTRKGVHTLFRQTERRFALEEQQRIDFKERLAFEDEYRQQGYVRIAGVDEVGRGPLAGPVVAAAVILPDGFYHPGLTDSKQMSKVQRQAALKHLQEVAEIAIGIIEPAEIDEINIYQASKRAMQDAVRQLQPDALLVDAMTLEGRYTTTLSYQRRCAECLHCCCKCRCERDTRCDDGTICDRVSGIWI